MRTPTVLVADDHDDCRDVYAIFLRHHGYEVIEARDGRSALELAREHLPDAVVLDYHMPHLNGAEVIRALRADVRTAGLPALVVSADAAPEARAAVQEAGCRSFALKPFHPRALWLAVAGLTDRSSHEAARPLRVRRLAAIGS
jgi:CheY-like chemotaxis protein